MLTLEPATIDDLAEAMSWSPDDASFQLWAGPGVAAAIPVEAAWRALTPPGRLTFATRGTDGSLRGFGQLCFNEENWGHLARLVVAPGCRGQGVGRRLCLALMRRAEEVKPALIGWTLNVYPHNRTARRLYESLGFATCGEVEGMGLRMTKRR